MYGQRYEYQAVEQSYVIVEVSACGPRAAVRLIL